MTDSVICGGNSNILKGNSSAILCGSSNELGAAGSTGNRSAILNGSTNINNGIDSIIVGANNSIGSSATHAVAIGRNVNIGNISNIFAYSDTTGMNVSGSSNNTVWWGCGTDVDVSFQAFTIYTNGNRNTGMFLLGGSNAWAAVSDRNLKENIVELSYADMLAGVDQLPLYSYTFKDGGSQGYGPMAQDFQSIFRLRKDDKSINTLDMQTVALGAIRALHQELNETKKQLAHERGRNDALEARLTALEAR